MAHSIRDAHNRHFVVDRDGLLFGGPTGPMIVNYEDGQRFVKEHHDDGARYLIPVTWNKAVWRNGDLPGWRPVPATA